MHELILSGIPGSNPIGAMAALGLFRIVAEERPFCDVRMSWCLESDWRPVLHSSHQVDVDDLIQFLIDRQPGRTAAPFLNWNNDIKCAPSEFRMQLDIARNEWLSADRVGDYGSREWMQFLCAFGCETIRAKSTPDVKPTALHMTAGQQRFLKSVVDLSSSLDPQQRSSRRQSEEQRQEEIKAEWNETLRGPWRYSSSEHSLGWDPTTEGLHALSDRSPSAAGPRSVRGAVWLAFESLPLFPTVPGEHKLLTTGFHPDGGAFTWPIWQPAITLDAVRVLLNLPDLFAVEIKARLLRSRGIVALFRSQCRRDGNGRGTFRNAVEMPLS